MTAWQRWATAPGRTVRGLRAALDEGRATEVHLEDLRTVPGWVLRVVAGLLATALLVLAAVAAVAGGRTPLAVGPLAVGAVCAAATALRPATGWAGATVLAAGFVVLAGPARGLLAVAALVALAHADVVVAGLAARAAPRTRVEIAVLPDALRDAVPVQLGAQVLGVVAVLTSRVAAGGGGLPAGDLWRAAALVGAAALVVIVLPPKA